MGGFGEGKIAFGGFPVLGDFHQDGADEAQEGGFVGEESRNGGAAAHLAVEVFAGVGGAQAAALGVGAGAWLLLQREESRLLQRTELAEAARRAAVEARARLVAENVELLVGDVEAGLLDTLAGAPAAGLTEFLGDWERTNPLVRTAFLDAGGNRLAGSKDCCGAAACGLANRSRLDGRDGRCEHL